METVENIRVDHTTNCFLSFALLHEHKHVGDGERGDEDDDGREDRRLADARHGAVQGAESRICRRTEAGSDSADARGGKPVGRNVSR